MVKQQAFNIKAGRKFPSTVLLINQISLIEKDYKIKLQGPVQCSKNELRHPLERPLPSEVLQKQIILETSKKEDNCCAPILL